jgi:hypothetical protein
MVQLVPSLPTPTSWIDHTLETLSLIAMQLPGTPAAETSPVAVVPENVALNESIPPVACVSEGRGVDDAMGGVDGLIGGVVDPAAVVGAGVWTATDMHNRRNRDPAGDRERPAP